MSVSVVPNRMVICDQVMKENFTGVTLDEMNFLSETVCQINPDFSRLAQFLLLTNHKLNTGRLAFSFNDDVRSSINGRNRAKLTSLFQRSLEDSFPEFYRNPNFTQNEREIIDKMVKREYNTILNTLHKGNSHMVPQSLKYLPCELDVTTLSTPKQSVSLYQKCYEDICIQESSNDSELPISSSLYNSGSPPVNVYAPDITDGGVPMIYCFKIVEILPGLVSGEIRTPSGKVVSALTINLLRHKLDKEIKMYRYYLEHRK